MTVALDRAAEELIRDELRKAQYATAEEVVLAGLRALSKLREHDAYWADIKAKVREGLADEAAGDLSDGEAFFDELDLEDA